MSSYFIIKWSREAHRELELKLPTFLSHSSVPFLESKEDLSDLKYLSSVTPQSNDVLEFVET